jgi:hypothetical protein
MNRTVLNHIHDYLRQPTVLEKIQEVENGVQGTRGPAREMSLYSLLVTKIYGSWMHHQADIRSGAMHLVNDAQPDELEQIGISKNNVSYDMVRDLHARVSGFLTPPPGADLTDLDCELSRLADVFLAASVGELPERLQVAVDTTLLQAYCTSRGCKDAHAHALEIVDLEYADRDLHELREFDEMADAHVDDVDSSGHTIVDELPRVRARKGKSRSSKSKTKERTYRSSCDPHAGPRAYQHPDGTLKRLIMGYGAVAITCSTPGVPEWALRLALIPANRNDVPVGAQLVLGLADMYGIDPTTTVITADRAFNNQATAFSRPLVRAGYQFTYDLKVTDRFTFDPQHPDKLPATYLSYLQICGRLFAPHMPRKLWEIELPMPGATKEAWEAYWEIEDQRATYEVVLNGRRGNNSHSVKVRGGCHPKVKKWKCDHPSMKPLTDHWDVTLDICPGDHADDEACCLQNFTVDFDEFPRVWQFPGYGTREWKECYDRRGAVERNFASLKYNCGWSATRAKVRGIGAVGFSLVLALVVHNLRLQFPEARHVPNSPRVRPNATGVAGARRDAA